MEKLRNLFLQALAAHRIGDFPPPYLNHVTVAPCLHDEQNYQSKNLRVVSSIPDGVWLFSLPNIPKWKQKNQMKWMKLMKRMKLKKLMILRKQNYFCINGEHRKVLALPVPISLKIPGFNNPGNFSDIARAPPGALASISSITLATVRRREPVPFELTILPLILP